MALSLMSPRTTLRKKHINMSSPSRKRTTSYLGKAILTDSSKDLEFNDLLLHITSRATDVDIFIDKHEPWRLAKDPDKREELHAVLYTAAECLRILCLYIYPFMPNTAENIAEQLGIAVTFGSPLLSKRLSGANCKAEQRSERELTFPSYRIKTTRSQDRERITISPSTNIRRTDTSGSRSPGSSADTGCAGPDHHRRVHEDSAQDRESHSAPNACRNRKSCSSFKSVWLEPSNGRSSPASVRNTNRKP